MYASNQPIYSNPSNQLAGLIYQEKITLDEELFRIEEQIAERIRIRRRNIGFLEHQRVKLEGFLNQTECQTYSAAQSANPARQKLLTQLVLMDMKKGDEYANAFRDIQRLEEQKRKLLGDIKEEAGAFP